MKERNGTNHMHISEIQDAVARYKYCKTAIKNGAEGNRCELMSEFEKAKDEIGIFVESNKNLVLQISERKAAGDFWLRQELEQEAIIRLFKCVLYFNPNKINPKTERPYEFSTYVTHSVKRHLDNVIAREKELPFEYYRKVIKMHGIKGRMTVELGMKPTDEEVAEEMSIQVGRTIKPERIPEMERHSLDKLSLNATFTREDGETEELIDRLPDYSSNVFDAVCFSQLREVAEQALEELDPRKKMILERRHEFDGKNWTLQQIADELGISRERVRQLESDGLEQLRISSIGQTLKEFSY